MSVIGVIQRHFVFVSTFLVDILYYASIYFVSLYELIVHLVVLLTCYLKQFNIGNLCH